MADVAVRPARGGLAWLQRGSTAGWLIGLVVVMCCIGVVMVGSASSVISMSYYGSPWSIFFKEVMWVVLGLGAFAVFCRVDYHALRKFAPLLVMGSFVLLVIVMVPGLGMASGGSSRWIGFGSFGIQPSEFTKLALALYGADIIAKRQEAGSSMRHSLAPVVLLTTGAALLVLAQPDMGTAMVLIVILLALVFAAGARFSSVLKGVGIVVALGTVAAIAMPYRRDRLLSFINPGAKSSGSGYQVVQSLIGMGSGHFFGLGLGNSREKWGLLPNAHTDFIFSVVGEELGLVGAIAVIVLVGAFAMKGWRAAEDATDRFGTLLAVALVAWISAEAVINIGAVIGVLPVTGIPLPFISFGGSSMLITMTAAGILVSIARRRPDPRGDRRVARKAKSRSPRPSAKSSAQTRARRRPATSTSVARRPTTRPSARPTPRRRPAATPTRSAARRPAPAARSSNARPR